MKTIAELLDELSFLSRETVGASFVIQHCKDSGLWKVVFVNAMVMLKNDTRIKETDFNTALINGIDLLRSRRKPVEQVVEKYTMF